MRVPLHPECGWRLLLLPLVASFGCQAQSAMKPRGPEAVPVKVEQVVRKPMALELRAVGSVEASSKVSVSARAAGTIVAAHFQEGSEVQRGELLFELDPRPYQASLAEAQSRLARDRTLAEKAAEDERRYTALVEKEYVTREQFEGAKANAASLRSTVQADEAAVENARLALEYCTIRAPISGRTGSLLVHAGNMVRQNDAAPLVVILQTRPVRVAFAISEKHLEAIRAHAAAAPLRVSVRSRGGTGEPVIGKLEFIDNSVDQATGTILLKGVFDNQDGRLWPGQFVDVVLTLGSEEAALVVPSTAVQTGQQGSYVFVVTPDGTAESRPVTVARVVGAESVLAAGVEPDETVVTDGQLRLVPGAKVAVTPPVARAGDAPSAGPSTARP
jgi:membrane fusion protein, multidrug efflux system